MSIYVCVCALSGSSSSLSDACRVERETDDKSGRPVNRPANEAPVVHRNQG